MHKIFKFIVIVAIGLVLPQFASAATVYLEASRNTLSVGDTAVVAVKINADGGVINTIEGDVALNSLANNAVVQEFSLANSSFGLWPRTPSLSADGKIISFVGGVPGGFSIEGATVFKIILEARKPGRVTISPKNISVYQNDGQGTKLQTQFKDIVIDVVAAQPGTEIVNDWAAIVSRDVTKPEDFIIVPGQTNSLFEGKKFVFFSAIDNQSGIDYYEVSEDGKAAVRSGSTYVLQDQSGNVELTVTAYDKAGNRRVVKSLVEPEDKISWKFVISVIFIGIVLKVVYKIWKRRKSNASFSSQN